jgi:nucleoside phosphorylase
MINNIPLKVEKLLKASEDFTDLDLGSELGKIWIEDIKSVFQGNSLPLSYVNRFNDIFLKYNRTINKPRNPASFSSIRSFRFLLEEVLSKNEEFYSAFLLEDSVIGIYIALSEELDVLKEEINLEPNGKFLHRGKRDGIDIVVYCPDRIGRVYAAIGAMVLTREYKPKMLINLGISGGFRTKKVKTGDVIIPLSVIDGAIQKIMPDKTENRPETYNANETFRSLFINIDKQELALNLIRLDKGFWPKGLIPVFHADKNIICLDQVIANNDLEERVDTFGSNIAAIEMEAGAIAKVCQYQSIPFFAIKGISDYADALKSDDMWRRLAMKAAVKTLCSVDFSKIII